MTKIPHCGFTIGEFPDDLEDGYLQVPAEIAMTMLPPRKSARRSPFDHNSALTSQATTCSSHNASSALSPISGATVFKRHNESTVPHKAS